MDVEIKVSPRTKHAGSFPIVRHRLNGRVLKRLLLTARLFAGAVVAVGLSGNGPPQSSMSFRLDDNLVHVDAAVNGQAVSAVVDSGTGMMLVDRQLAKRLKLKEGQPIGPAQGGGTTPESLFPVNLRTVAVGPRTLTNVPGVSMNTENLSRSARFPVDALLGSPLFLSGPIRIDYPRRRVTFFSPGEAPACKSWLAVTIVHGVPRATATLRANANSRPETLRLYVDLGTRHFAALLGKRFLATETGKAMLAEGTPQQLGTGTGGAIVGVPARAYEIGWGNRRYRNVVVGLTRHVAAFNTPDADGSLGVPLWKDGTIVFDDANSRLCLQQEP